MFQIARPHRRRRPGARRRHIAAALTAATLGILNGCERSPLSIDEASVIIERSTPGRGAPVRNGETVCVSYRLEFLDGKVLMDEPRTCFVLGEQNVIEGIHRTVEGMQVGSTRTVRLHPHLHWGSAGYGPVPKSTTLRMELTLLSIGSEGFRSSDGRHLRTHRGTP